MKMENNITADKSGTVTEIKVSPGQSVGSGDVIVVMSQRPATVSRIIPVGREERDRASVAYAHKLAETLACLGVNRGAS